jgi:hypothetical protein
MPRLRLFVKKRGTRRTSPRWTGLLAEALLFAALVAVGVFGMFWIMTRVLLAEGAAYGWWPWLAAVIPLALILYGSVSLVFLLWQSAASSERRAAVVQKVSELELTGVPSKPTRPALPAVPPIDALTDSPGVQLAYRLPIEASSGWVSLTMAAVCLGWNTLVAIFVVQVIRLHLEGQPNWLLTWLMVPFVLAGAWTLVMLARQVLFDVAIGTTRLEISHQPFYPGETSRGFVSQTGRIHVRWLQVQLQCDEHAVYQQGTDARRATSRVYRATVFSKRKFDISPDAAFDAEFDIAVPDTGMHSFVSAHNAIVWTLAVRGRVARWGDFERRFPVYVYPASSTRRRAGDAPTRRTSLRSR